MSSRRSLVIVGSIGAGFLIGGGAIWWLWGRRFIAEVNRLTVQVQALRREVERLQTLLHDRLLRPGDRNDHTVSRPPHLTGRFTQSAGEAAEQLTELSTSALANELVDQIDSSSARLSSTDEEEIYEEAYDGPMPWLTGLSSTLLRDDNLATGSAAGDSQSSSEELTELFTEVDKLLDSSDTDKEEAYRILTERRAELLNNANFMWRLSKSTYFVSQIEASRDKEKQRVLVYESKDIAEAALALDQNNPNAHKWFAITLGSLGDYESLTKKIENGYTFKTHIEKAIALNPTDPTGHYLLGRWCFGVYMLSWMERKVAATLFAAPPSATIDEALSHFLEADRLKPGVWKENLLFIAKCYIQMRDYRAAVSWLDKANDLISIGQDDEKAQEEIDSALSQYGSYRN